jgi:hypothetical protein
MAQFLCFACGKPFEGVCDNCLRARLAELRAQSRARSMRRLYRCAICGVRQFGPFAEWVEDVCEKCLSSLEGRALLETRHHTKMTYNYTMDYTKDGAL